MTIQEALSQDKDFKHPDMRAWIYADQKLDGIIRVRYANSNDPFIFIKDDLLRDDWEVKQ
jgi:hypothetical protein